MKREIISMKYPLVFVLSKNNSNTSYKKNKMNEGLFKWTNCRRRSEGKEMDYFSHAVKAGDLKPGDHIYTWRKAFIYSHHGIYVGANKVVHFTNDQILCSSGPFLSTLLSSSSASEEEARMVCSDYPDCCLTGCGNGVIMSCLNCFLGNGSLRRFQYGVGVFDYLVKIRSGTCTTAKSDTPETVIQRAMYLLEEGFGSYDLRHNNCEDFALYCKTCLLVSGKGGYGGSGQASSVLSAPKSAFKQIALELVNPFSSGFAAKKTIISSLVRSPLATGTSFVVSNPVGVVATVTRIYVNCKMAADIGRRNDVTKVELEGVSGFIAKKLAQ